MTRTSTLLTSLVVSLMALTSCNRADEPHTGISVWGPSSYGTPPVHAGEQLLPGTGQGSMVMGLRSHGASQDPVFLVWAGESGGGQIAGKTDVSPTNTTQRIDKYEGTLAGVAVTCQTADGKTGTVTIGTQSFDLEKGALFLVSRNGSDVALKQMKLSKLNLQPEGALTLEQLTHGHFQKLAESDSDIREFWRTATRK